MKRFLFIALLIGCGETINDWEDKLYPEYEPYVIEREEPVPSIAAIVDDFLYDCGELHGADVSKISKLKYIRYGDPTTEAKPFRIGVCYSNRNKNGSIVKSRIVVEKLKSKIRLKALIYHELGHCVMGFPHAPQEPYSIMSPAIKSKDSYYEEHWDDLVEQFCKSK